jgi:hypothetical protein
MTQHINPTPSRGPRPAARVRLVVALLATALAIALPSCKSAPQPVKADSICASQASLVNPLAIGSGIGGTGAPAAKSDPGGIGGTGQVAGKPVFGEGGIGGTGIVGVVTGFASICVNGVEVQYDATTPVWDNGQAGSLRQLAVGQIVSVTALGGGAQPKARGIAMIHALVGPVDAIDTATGRLQVMGQKVVAIERGDAATLRAGDWVRVSGLRLATGEIAASRIQALPGRTAATPAQVRGPVTAMQGNTWKVGDTPVDMGSLTFTAAKAIGQELWVSGTWNGRVLQARESVAEPTREGLGRVERVVLEGYIHQLNEREISLGFQSLQLKKGMQIVGGSASELAVNRRVQVTGSVGDDQRITVERVEFSNYGGGEAGSSSTSSSGKSRNSGKGSSSSGSSGSSSGSGSSGSGSSGSGSSGSGSGSSGSGSGSGGSGSGSGGSGGGGSSGGGSSGSGGK